MPYTAMQQLDLIKTNKIKLINKINTLLGKDSGLTWDSSWTAILTAINSIKTLLPEENHEIINEIEKFLANNSIGEVIINSDEIIPYAFYKKNTIASLVGPNVKTVGTYAFYNDSQLISVNLPEVETIRTLAFCNIMLSELNLPKVTTIESQGFQGNSALLSVELPKLNKINAQVFQDCTMLGSLNIPNLTHIETYGFYNTKIKLTDLPIINLTYLGSYAMAYCPKLNEGLDSIEILPQNNLTISSYCFQNSNLSKDIFVGNNVTSIGSYAFSNCGSNTKFWCEAPSKPSGWDSSWNSSNYPVNWGCVEKEYTFVKNNGEEDITLTKRYITSNDFPIIEKDGYQLDSWYLDENFIEEVSTPYYSKVNTTESTTFYARWVRGFNLKAINLDDNYSETDLGTYYFNSIRDFKNYIEDFNCIGYYQSYSNQTFDNIITDLDLVEGFLPTIYVKVTNTVSRIEIQTFDYTGEVAQTTLLPGDHRIECWGAQGGDTTNGYYGGKGGYSEGSLSVSSAIDAYVYVGARGQTNSSALIFNGGGEIKGSPTSYAATGGGASDVRLGQDSLYARVIVAGAGGGATWYSSSNGGAGGGLEGTISPGNNSSNRRGLPGTQTHGGSYTSLGSPSYNVGEGGFGFGGYGYSAGNNGWPGAGGGSGWYGGGGGVAAGGAGGSGYTYTETTAQNYPTGCLLNASQYLTSARTIDGTQEFLAPDGTLETGHGGNGYVKITSSIRSQSGSIFTGCTIYIKGILDQELIDLSDFVILHNIYREDLANKYGTYEVINYYTDEELETPLEFPYEIPLTGSLTIFAKIVQSVDPLSEDLE